MSSLVTLRGRVDALVGDDVTRRYISSYTSFVVESTSLLQHPLLEHTSGTVSSPHSFHQPFTTNLPASTFNIMGRKSKYVSLDAFEAQKSSAASVNTISKSSSSSSLDSKDSAALSAETNSTSLHSTQPSPYGIAVQLRQARNLVCIDLECHWYNQSRKQWLASRQNITTRRVCEIGIAVMNTTDINSATLGDRSSALWSQDSTILKGVNIGIKEHRHNPSPKNPCRYTGCRVGFVEDFDFGPVVWCWLSNVVKTIAREIGRRINPKYPVTFLFFDSGNDVKWLNELGFDLESQFPDHQMIDIQREPLATMLAQERGISQLGAKADLHALGMEIVRPHNGGNDAMYELRGMLAEWSLTAGQQEEIRAGGSCLPFLDRFGRSVEGQQVSSIDDDEDDLAMFSAGDFPPLI